MTKNDMAPPVTTTLEAETPSSLGPASKSDVASTYDSDVYLWAVEQAEHIRVGRYEKVDQINAADEIEDVGRREYDAVVSNLAIVVAHMLKWDFQPAKRSRSWTNSIGACRDQVEYRLLLSPSLKSKRNELLTHAFRLARRRASRDTGLDISTFPEQCAYSWQDVIERGFVPPETNERA